MSFNIPPIDNYKEYIELALRTARKDLSQKSFKGDKRNKNKSFEIERQKIINNTLRTKLEQIVKSFPNFDNLSEFYEELVRTTLDFDEVKASLGALNWASEQISIFTREHRHNLIKCEDIPEMQEATSKYIGRVTSVFKQIRNNLEYLEKTRVVMRDFPSIRDECFTVAIAGFPNVGKSTLLSKLTTSTPDIQPYAFTTKTLNIGYMKKGYHKIQFIDTPGTLNRMDKMNKIEKIAYLAIKYCADLIIYVYDLTETYPIEDQHALLKKLKRFDKDVIIFTSKTDIIPKKVISEFVKKHEDIITDIEQLKEMVLNKI